MGFEMEDYRGFLVDSCVKGRITVLGGLEESRLMLHQRSWQG